MLPPRIALRYACLNHLGDGLLGSTWRASDRADGRHVILKMLNECIFRCSVETLRRLSWTQARLQDMALLLHHDIGEVAFLVRPDVAAVPLESSPPLETAVARLIAIVEALAPLHTAGVVHGYLKPSNVLLKPDGGILLTDGGLSPLLEAVPQDVAVTARYLSPEHFGLVGGSITPRSDLYSVGLLAWRLLTGRDAIEADDLSGVLHAHAGVQLGAVSEISGAPAFLDEIVRRLLHKEPAERYRSTHELLRDLLESRARLGRSDSVSRQPRDQPAPEGDPTLAGRERHLRDLTSVLDDVRAGRPRVTRIEGLAGSGKTSLVSAMRARCAERGVVFALGKCHVSSDERPYEALVEASSMLVEQWTRLPETRRIWVQEVLEEMLGAHASTLSRIMPPLVPLLGRPDSEVGHVKQAVIAFVRAVAAAWQPLVLVLDDVQWAPPVLLDLLDHLAAHVGDHPVWLMLTCRSEEAPERPLPGDPILCEPLLPQDVKAWVTALQVDDDAFLGEFLAQRSRGNPFWMVEILRLLQARGAVTRSPFGWQVDTAACAAVELPERLAEITLRRLEDLDEDVRETLALAGVAGDAFDPALLAAARERPLRQIVEACSAAARAQLIEAREGGFQFLHDRIRETVVGSLDRDAQARCHRLLAASMERDPAADPFVLAHHFERAGDTVRAIPHQLAAARAAAEAWSFASSIPLCQRAARSSQPQQRREALRLLGDALHAVGRFEESVQVLERLLAETDAPQDRVAVLLLMSRANQDGARLLEAERNLVDALGLLDDPPPRNALSVAHEAGRGLLRLTRAPQASGRRDDARRRTLVRLWHLLATTRYFLAQVPSTAAHLASFHRAQGLGDCEELVLVWSAHSTVLGTLRFVDHARVYGRASIEMARRLGDRRAEGAATYQYAFGLLCAMLWDEAAAMFEDALQVNAQAGEMWRANACTFMRAFCFLQAGRGMQAREAYEAYRTRWRDMGEASMGFHLEASFHYLASRLALLEGRLDEARDAAERAIAESRGTPSPLYRIMAASARGRTALAEGDAESARQVLAPAFEEMRRRTFFQTMIADVPGLLAETYATLYEQTKDERWLRSTDATIAGAAWWARLQPLVAPSLWRARARTAAARGQRKRAGQAAGTSLQSARRLGMGHEEGLTLLALGRMEAQWGDTTSSVTLMRAEQLLRRAGDLEGARRAGGESQVTHTPSLPSPAGRLATQVRRDRMLELSREIATTLSFDELVPRVLSSALDVSGAQRASLLLRASVMPSGERGRPVLLGDALVHAFGDEMPQPRPAIEETWSSGRTVRVDDADERVDLFRDEPRPRAVVVLPLAVGPASLGVLHLDSTQVRSLAASDDLGLLEALAGQIAVAIHNALNVLAVRASYEEALAERERRHRQQVRLKSLRARKNALTAFLGVASHDLKNPLQLIRMSVGGLRASEGEAASHYDAIDYAARRANDLVATWLDAVRAERGRALDLDLRPFDTVALVRDELAFQLRCISPRRAAGLGVQTELAPLDIHGDQERVRQVVGNLLSNALKFSPDGGCVRVTSTEVDGRWRFTVEDEGPGIDPDLRPRLFRAFQRGRALAPGSGLGLWICRRITEAHGGDIGVDDGHGGGSRFWFTLPVSGSAKR